MCGDTGSPNCLTEPQSLSIRMSAAELAINGGIPAFIKPVHVNKPYSATRSAYETYFDRAWRSEWFTNDGQLVRELEERLEHFLGVRECVLTTNGTTALELTLRALKLQGEVILPAYTFISTANILTLMGLKPIFCDIDPDTLNLCPKACAGLITDRTAAIIPTHVWGRPCATKELQTLCNHYGLKLIFDSAHAFGCKTQERFIGGFGDAEVFSLHATKVLHSFEGGFVATNDVELAETLRVSRNFGFTALDQIALPGTNAKMSESHAAMGLANLDEFETIKRRAKACFETYKTHLNDIPGILLSAPDSSFTPNYHYVAASLDSSRFGISRDHLVTILSAEGILARRYFYPGSHRLKPYANVFSQTKRNLPVTDKVCTESLVLPGGAAMDSQDAQTICEIIKLIFEVQPKP